MSGEGQGDEWMVESVLGMKEGKVKMTEWELSLIMANWGSALADELTTLKRKHITLIFILIDRFK